MDVVAFYIGANAILMVVLAYLVGSKRGAQRALDPGATGDVRLTRAMRAHGNFAEYAALALLVLVSLALLDYPRWVLHLVGVSFTLGRIAHAIGMNLERHPNAPRFVGNAITGLTLLAGGTACMVPAIEAF